MAKLTIGRGAWTTVYWSDTTGNKPVEAWLDALSDEQLSSVADEVKLLEQCGNNLRLPHSLPLKDGLFELRERRYHLRIYYCFHGRKIIVLLAAGNKGTQKSDIKTARERLQRLINKGKGKKS